MKVWPSPWLNRRLGVEESRTKQTARHSNGHAPRIEVRLENTREATYCTPANFVHIHIEHDIEETFIHSIDRNETQSLILGRGHSTGSRSCIVSGIRSVTRTKGGEEGGGA